MIAPPSHSAEYYVEPTPGDFRQGDIYRDVLHVMLSESGYAVLRTFQGRGGRTLINIHDEENPPQGGFKWAEKERVQADGQLGLAVVLTHDCEIENDDSRHHRLIGLLRPLDRLNEHDRNLIVEGRHYGRLYIPSWPDVGLAESYLDLRRITTIRNSALPDENRIASMTDFGRRLLHVAVIQYLTELYRGDDETR